MNNALLSRATPESDPPPSSRVFSDAFGAPCAACQRPTLSETSSLCAECECDRAEEQGTA
jgi:hypothetical protein